MATSMKMVSLPGLLFCLVLLKTCLGSEHTTASASISEMIECPGDCLMEQECTTALNDTDCASGLVCCVDNLEQMTTTSTEYVDWRLTTQDTVEWDSTKETQFADDSHTIAYSFVEAGADESNEDFYVVSEESAELALDAVAKGTEVSMVPCPGNCVPAEYGVLCDHVYDSSEGSCDRPGDVCCKTNWQEEEVDPDVEAEETEYANLGRSADSSAAPCPGTCVHPSHSLFCEQILPQFSCPLNSKCCIKRSSERSISTPVECTGLCLSRHMQVYCFPPNEIIMGSTTCPYDSICCMRRPVESPILPPSVHRMKFPSAPPKLSSSQAILGHLAIDEDGKVYKVATNGRISALPRLTERNPSLELKRLMAYPRFDGEIVIFSDSMGALYQQFYPRQTSVAQESKSPLIRQPIHQFASTEQEKHEKDDSQSGTKTGEPDEGSKDVLDDVVIPDKDDEALVPENIAPVIYDGKNSPPCPGSCMSYFLRFTCFRGFATYDGFSCPGKSVCCARLKDIEDHEEYLKSLSPYFNTSPASREKTFHRCGVKGRRDTPRIMGGKESLPGEWCWQVAIINVQNQYVCGGALIDNSWVLTAAHCVVGPMREGEALFVRAGVTDLKSSEDNNKGQTRRVLSTFVHHNFNSINLDNNIALLRLQKSLDLNDNICVICLPTSGNMPQPNSKCTVTGYGFVSTDGDMSLRISEAQVPVIDDVDCMANVTEALTSPFILPASSFCAGGQGRQDACQGDAGGPLACETAGYHELVGLVSWGLGCGRNDVPSIYIKVPAFMGWINQIISSSSFLMSLN